MNTNQTDEQILEEMEKYSYLKKWVILASIPLIFLALLFYFISDKEPFLIYLSIFSILCFIIILYKAIFVNIIFSKEKIIYKSLFITKEIKSNEIYDIIIIRKRRRCPNEFISYDANFTVEHGTSHYLMIRKHNSFPIPYYNLIKPVSENYITVQFRKNMKEYLKNFC